MAGRKNVLSELQAQLFNEKIIFRIQHRSNPNIFIELKRCGLNKCKNLSEWIKGKYIAKCGDITCCYDNKYEAICRLAFELQKDRVRLALELQKDRVRYYKELEDRGLESKGLNV